MQRVCCVYRDTLFPARMLLRYGGLASEQATESVDFSFNTSNEQTGCLSAQLLKMRQVSFTYEDDETRSYNASQYYDPVPSYEPILEITGTALCGFVSSL